MVQSAIVLLYQLCLEVEIILFISSGKFAVWLKAPIFTLCCFIESEHHLGAKSFDSPGDPNTKDG